MNVYLVGGAVRDRLLNSPIKERDWVVVGATPNEMQRQGFQQVGRDFPVFLHPQSKEEYALARKERKQAPGYYGFACDFSPEVTLEEDLARRDLTINAMAQDLTTGKIIDPYGGQDDLKNKILRHVSPAFVEDPVRVLRVARFAARYHHLGFRVANETRFLMYTMVKQGELNHLVPERVWQEWQRSLQEKNPEVFIETLRACGALPIVFPELHALFGVPNPQRYHAEIDSGIHTLMVLQACASLASEPEVRFAACVHDLGKARTPMQNWPAQHGHEKLGVPIIKSLCQRLRIPVNYRDLALLAARYHLHIHRFFELRANTIVLVLERADAFRRPELFKKLLKVCEADAKGKGHPDLQYPQAENWLYVLAECMKITAKEFVAQGYQGQAIKSAIHEQRVRRTQELLAHLSRKKYEK
ncbi:multifunctional CCA addition/repair protein [Legionella sp. 27cVA30]|uniref:multifunctional CCA addition/repair protein n=1 Tax=Legionella sp. 27cVA30 TaxID=2905657 RepID=UPI00209CFBB1|nr:multifunctional CCA addition/repair protein [Legionella sp. 27cVA30]MCP0913892.1 multifunctional CCA addition/repair protein [Legionella sp. 27cVA30]